MRLALVTPVFLMLAACGEPFVADPSLPVPPREPTASDRAIGAYIDCVNGYAVTRASYDVTVEELADAAIGACPRQLDAVRQVYAQTRSAESSLRLMDYVRDEARRGVVTIIVEARNLHKSAEEKPKVTGT